jgi:hypothetical protein
MKTADPRTEVLKDSVAQSRKQIARMEGANNPALDEYIREEYASIRKSMEEIEWRQSGLSWNAFVAQRDAAYRAEREAEVTGDSHADDDIDDDHGCSAPSRCRDDDYYQTNDAGEYVWM